MYSEKLKQYIGSKVFMGRVSMSLGTFFVFWYLWDAQWVVASMEIPKDSWIYLTVLIAASWVIAGLFCLVTMAVVLTPLSRRLMGGMTGDISELKDRAAQLTAIENRYFMSPLSAVPMLTGILACVQLVKPNGWPVVYLVIGSIVSILHFSAQCQEMERDI